MQTANIRRVFIYRSWIGAATHHPVTVCSTCSTKASTSSPTHGLFLSAAAVLLGMLTCSAHVRADDAPRPAVKSTAAERTKAFEWFSGLGYPDVKGRKYVRVATGDWFQAGNAPPTNTHQRGFVLAEEGERFTVLTLSLAEPKYKRTPADTPSYKQVGYTATELKTGATAYLENLRKPPKEQQWDAQGFGGVGLHLRTQTFVLAWACWRHGLNELAAGLFDEAARTPTGYGYNPDTPPKEPLLDLVAADLAHTEMWRAVLACGEAEIPRLELLKRFEHITKHYPASAHLKDAKAAAAVLRRMIHEDAEHAKAAKPFAKLRKQEQIAELIFQLREQNGHQFMQPGACDIFDRIAGKEDTPAHKLVKFGYDAVPQLIEHLDDDRFTRSIGFHRNFYFSHHVLRVSDCALVILERIASRTFWRATSTFSYMSMDQKNAETKKAVQQWYEELKQKGEKQLLIEAVARGNRDSYDQATRLVERYPKDALPALLAGVKAAKDRWTRDLLVATIAELQQDAVLPFLFRELKEGPSAYGRLLAARSLHKRGRPEGLKAMIAEWQGKWVRPKPAPGTTENEIEGPEGNLVSIAHFLAGCGDVEAIAALAKDLRQRPVPIRMAVVSCFGTAGNMHMAGAGGMLTFGEGKTAELPREVRATIEKLLVAELDDTAEQIGVSGNWNGKSFTDPRICDVAANVLSDLKPKKYRFDLGAPLMQRDRTIVELKNVWRTAQGMPPLPLPKFRQVARAPDDQLRALLDRLLQAADGDRRRVEVEIEALGLGALPGTLEQITRTSKKEDQAVLGQLARRLATIVDGVHFADGPVKVDTQVASRFTALKGKPFDPERFVSAVRASLNRLPKGAAALRIAVDRAEDGTGITVTVSLFDAARASEVGNAGSITPAKPPAPGERLGWNFTEHVATGTKGLHGASGVTSRGQWQDADQSSLRQALVDACAADPQEPISVRLLYAVVLSK
ncbi:MAG TPA: hypothetical protein VEL76_27535 [Gemmataceae bacterium]|nr:hypothetical protein [Gemmataceae bacterium]